MATQSQEPPPREQHVSKTGTAVDTTRLKRRSPVGVWLGLPLITLGIYMFVWIYKIHAEMDRANPRREVSAGGPLAAWLTAPLTLFIWPIVSTYRTGEHIAATQRAANQPPTANGWLGILLLVVFGLTPLYYQIELNKVLESSSD